MASDMKKNLLILVAVALLGILSVYASRQPDSTPSSLAAGYITGRQSYKDGAFIGNSADTPYGEVLVEATVKNGKLNDVKALRLPVSSPRADEISRRAAAKLKTSAIQAQSAEIDFVSGATMTSFSYQQSLQAALDRAALD